MVIRSTWRPFVVFTVALILAAGFCLFESHGGGGHHGGVSDLCLGMLAASVTIVVLVGLLPAGWVPALPPVPMAFTSLLVRKPPPKTAFVC